MKKKFDFFEIVKIVSNKSELLENNGKIGTILGMTEDKNVNVYVIAIEDEEDDLYVYEYDLVSTHRFAKEEDFYTGESIKVLVSPDGKGRLEDE